MMITKLYNGSSRKLAIGIVSLWIREIWIVICLLRFSFVFIQTDHRKVSLYLCFFVFYFLGFQIIIIIMRVGLF